MKKIFLLVIIMLAVGGMVYFKYPEKRHILEKFTGPAPADSQKPMDYSPAQGGAVPTDSNRLLDSPAEQEEAGPSGSIKLVDNPYQTVESSRASNTDLAGTTDKEFDNDVIKASGPVVVEFWRPGCKYCEQLEPELVKLADRLPGRFKIVKVNTGECLETTRRFPVTGVPTVFLFENGSITKVLGGRTAQELKDELKLN